MIKVRETLLIIVLFLGVGCQLCNRMTDFSDVEVRDFSYDLKSLYTLDRGKNLIVDGRELGAAEAEHYSMGQRLISGSITEGQYNDWIIREHNLPHNSFGDGYFYLEHGEIKPVPKRGTIEWMGYERSRGLRWP